MTSSSDPSLHVRDIPRVNEISLVLARNGFGHLLGLMGLNGAGSNSENTVEATPLPKRIRSVVTELGPTFVKFGQVLSVRPDLLPPSLIAEFETLRDRVPPMPDALIRKVVERELGQPLDMVFGTFDMTPLGSASIGQVHRATLSDGQEVAVKVQRDGIAKKIRSDIHILYSLAQLLDGRLTLPGLHTMSEIVREFEKALLGELDFLSELRSAERMAQVHEDEPRILVPKVYPQLSTQRLLVMELVQGESITNAIMTYSDEDKEDIAKLLMEATYHQVFVAGFFHGDPHPGNLLVTPDKRLAMIDFGVTGSLTGKMQDTLVAAFTSLIFRDPENLAMTLQRAGALRGRIDLKSFTVALEQKMHEYHGVSLDDFTSRATFIDLVQLCTDYKIGLPPEFAVLSRATTLIEVSVRGLLPGKDIVAEVQPYAQRLLVSRLSPNRVATETARWMMQAQGHLREFPTQLSQLLMDLENGELKLQVRNPDMPSLQEEIRLASQRLTLALFASVTTLVSVMALTSWMPSVIGLPLFGLVAAGGLGVSLLLFLLLWWHHLVVNRGEPSKWRQRVLRVVKFLWWKKADQEDG